MADVAANGESGRARRIHAAHAEPTPAEPALTEPSSDTLTETPTGTPTDQRRGRLPVRRAPAVDRDG